MFETSLLVILLIIFLMVVFSRVKVAGPNEAFIITGRKSRAVKGEPWIRSTDLSGQKVVMGTSVFVLPVVQRKQSLDLSSRRIPVDVKGAISKRGIRVHLNGVAFVRIEASEEAVRAAAQRFLDQQQDIEHFTREILTGSLRAVVGRLTVEEIIGDRAAFAGAVVVEAEHSLARLGLVLDTFQLQDVLTEGSYLQDLARPEAARVLRDAAIAEAKSSQAVKEARLLADEAIATAERNLSVKKAQIRAEAAEVARSAGLIAAEAGRQATLAAAQAEVEAMRLKADALAQYGETAVLELLGRPKASDQEAA